jgi:hypothetical protein
MAIFSRRIPQQLINENNKFLSKNQSQKHVDGLNRAHKELNLAYEWEVVLLNALSKVGRVKHEKKFGGKNLTDIYFESSDNPDHNFVADITTVSDKGLKEQNPVEALWEHLSEILEDRGLRPNSFSLYVEDEMIFDNQVIRKAKLKLPGRSRFRQVIFDKKFDNFLSEILKDPQKLRTHVIENDDADLTIEYDPNQKFASGGHRCYDQVFSKTENIIYPALYKKISQLHGTKFKGPIGIFLCDGSCSLLNAKLLTGSFTVDDIIKYFLNLNSSIYFVITVRVEQKPPVRALHSKKPSYQIKFKLYKGQLFNNMGVNINKILAEMITIIPEPQSDTLNALNLLKSKKPMEGRLHFGGRKIKMGNNKVSEVRISGRELIELLAGKLQQKKCFERLGIGFNPFEIALKNGQLIDEVYIEKSDYEDDDWIGFKLKGPDPAISPYVMPIFKKK